jgi:Flp pilus assembly protein TadG
MPPSSPSIDDGPALCDDTERGSAALEFILVGLLLLVPMVYLIVALGLIQEQSLGAEAAARHVARAMSTATGADEARQRADRVLASVAEQYGIDDIDVAVACAPAAAACPSAGTTLAVTVSTRVTLPLVPPVLGLEQLAAVPVEATAAHKVSRFWGEP